MEQEERIFLPLKMSFQSSENCLHPKGLNKGLLAPVRKTLKYDLWSLPKIHSGFQRLIRKKRAKSISLINCPIGYLLRWYFEYVELNKNMLE